MLQIKKPETVYISFNGNPPNYFELRNADNNEVYYFRFLDGKTPRIKFNIPNPGEYFSNSSFKVVKVEGIKTPFNLPDLPNADRNRVKPVDIQLNFELTGTPACIYTDEGVIQISERFLDYPKPIRDFLYFHEYAHLFYSQEEDCDLFALVSSLRKGHNRSMLFYALSTILSRSPQNMRRIIKLFDKIQETQKTIL